MREAQYQYAVTGEPINLHKSSDDYAWGRAERTRRLLARMANEVDKIKEERLNGRLPVQ